MMMMKRKAHRKRLANEIFGPTRQTKDKSPGSLN